MAGPGRGRPPRPRARRSGDGRAGPGEASLTTDRPLVTVVLPTFNGERWLGEAIDSCRRQEGVSLEVVLVDDASTDRTPEIARERAARWPALRVVRHETNRRLPAALNTGFRHARGDLLTWTSDDNAYRPGALARMAAVLREDPRVDVVHADATVIDEHGAAVRRWIAGSARELPFRNPVGACFLYRRAVHEALAGYAEDLFLLEDYDFWVRAACRFRFRALHEDLYLYREHPASLSASRSREREALAERALTRALPDMPRALCARTHLHLARLARARGALAAARRHWRAAAWRAPALAARALAARGRGAP